MQERIAQIRQGNSKVFNIRISWKPQKQAYIWIYRLLP